MSGGAAGRALRGTIALRLPDAASEQAALDMVLDALAPLFEAVPAVDGERAGALLLVSDDAGSGTAVRFWRDAVAVGPALASPGAFPWCLANAPCATIARRFLVTGPNVTWLAERADAPDMFDAAADWLADYLLGAADVDAGAAPHAWIVALHAGAGARLAAWRWEADGTGAADDADAAAAALRARLRRDWAAAG